jgi:hypothetical protein
VRIFPDFGIAGQRREPLLTVTARLDVPRRRAKFGALFVVGQEHPQALVIAETNVHRIALTLN